MIHTCVTRAALTTFLSASICTAQPRPYVGVLGGASTLSADARTVPDPNSAASSSYSPENGATLDVLGGVHWNDYLSFQFDYLWNRNLLTLDSIRANAAGPASVYDRQFSSQQHSVSGNVLLYFRPRPSRFRPFLSVGSGAFHLSAEPHDGGIASGINPPARFSATKPTLQVAVGIDLKMRNGWAFRYSFSETLSNNPISAQLTPPGTRMLMNFRNLFGVVKTF